MRRSHWALCLLLGLTGCAGMRGVRPRSADCRARIDSCLAQCAPGQDSYNAAHRDQVAAGGDSRSSCEIQCDNLCSK